VLTWLQYRQAHIGVKGHVRDAITGQPLSNTVIHVKNITAGSNDDILHDVTSGKLGCLNICKKGELLTQSLCRLVSKPQTQE